MLGTLHILANLKIFFAGQFVIRSETYYPNRIAFYNDKVFAQLATLNRLVNLAMYTRNTLKMY